MKNFFKTTIFLLTIAVIFQSCNSDESNEELISNAEAITTDLATKIITTTTSLNDYNFFVNNVNCFPIFTYGFFNNAEGDYYAFSLEPVDSLEMWISQYNTAKLDAFNATGVTFTEDDFRLDNLFIIDDTGSLTFFKGTRELYLQYFENNCTIPNLTIDIEYGLFFSDINLNCNSDAVLSFSLAEDAVFIDDSEIGSIDVSTDNLTSVDDLLTDFNTQNNTNYGLENVKLTNLSYTATNGETVYLTTKGDLLNYFENCMLSKDNTNNCLSFVYPLQVNHTNQEAGVTLEEVAILENNNDLTTAFGTDIGGELSFVFPISLLGANGTTLNIESNEALENALDSAARYCD